jgi:hypothetical protein
MGDFKEEWHRLLYKVSDIVENPPPGVEPWKGKQIVALIERVSRRSSEHGAFYAEFMDGALDLVDDYREDRLLAP